MRRALLTLAGSRGIFRPGPIPARVLPALRASAGAQVQPPFFGVQPAAGHILPGNGIARRYLATEPPPPSSDFSWSAFRERLKGARNFEEASTAFTQTFLMPLLVKYPKLTVGGIVFSMFGGPAFIEWGYEALRTWYDETTEHNLDLDIFVRLPERIERAEDQWLLDACNADHRLKFIAVSGPEGSGKTVLVENMMSNLSDRSTLSDKVAKNYFPLVWRLDATDLDSLLNTTRKLAGKLNVNPALHPQDSKADVVKLLAALIKQKLIKEPRWVLVFDNISSMDLLKETDWYPSKSSADFCVSPQKRGRVVFVQRCQDKSAFNPFDVRVRDEFEFIHLGNLSLEEEKTLLHNIFQRFAIDEVAIPGLIDGILNLPIQGKFLPLVASTIGHYVADQWVSQGGQFDFQEYTEQLTSPTKIERLEEEYERTRSGEQFPSTLRRLLKNTLDQNTDPLLEQFIAELAFSSVNVFPDELLNAYAQKLGRDQSTLCEKMLALGWLSKQQDKLGGTAYVMHPAIQSGLAAIIRYRAWVAAERQLWLGSVEQSGVEADAENFEQKELRGLLFKTDRLDSFAKQCNVEKIEAQADTLLTLLKDGEVSLPKDLEAQYRIKPVLDAILKDKTASLDSTLQAKLYYLRGQIAKQLEDEETAAQYFDQALAVLSEADADQVLRADIYIQRGFCRLARGGAKDINVAYAIYKGLYGEADSRTLGVKLHVIKLLGMSGRYKKALESLNELQAAYETLEDPKGKAEVLFWKGFAHKTLGNDEEALKCYRSCETIRKSLYDDAEHVALAEVRHDIGVTLRHLSQTEGDSPFSRAVGNRMRPPPVSNALKAIRSLLQSVRFYEQAYDKLNPNYKKLAVAYHDLGLAYGVQGDSKQAETYLVKALRSRVAYHGKEHSAVARSLESLGDLFAKSSWPHLQDKAVTYYDQCLLIRQKAYGDNHNETARAYFKLAQACFLHEKKLSEFDAHEPNFVEAFAETSQLLSKSEQAYQAWRARMAEVSEKDPENANIQNMLVEVDQQLEKIVVMKEAIQEQQESLGHESRMSFNMA